MRYERSVVTAALILTTSFATRFASAQVKTPAIGIARLQDASVRLLYGIPENVIVDSHTFGSFDAASFSDTTGLVASKGRIELVKTDFTVIGEYDSAEPNPLLNVDGNETSAIAWLPASQSLLYWNGAHFVLKAVTGLDEGLRATALRIVNADTAQLLLVDTEGSVFQANISLASGSVLSVSAVPGVRRNAFWQGATILFEGRNGIESAGSRADLRTIAINAEDLSFAHISSTGVLITSRSEHRAWVMHVSGEDMQLSEVPAIRTKTIGVTR